MHMAVENQIVLCPVKLTKHGHPYIRCPDCYSVLFVNNLNGEALLKQLITEYAKLSQIVRQRNANVLGDDPDE